VARRVRVEPFAPGEGYRHGELVETGLRGVWRDPLLPGEVGVHLVPVPGAPRLVEVLAQDDPTRSLQLAVQWSQLLDREAARAKTPAERRVWELSRTDTVAPDVPRYLNRLSDLLFVIARVLARHEQGSEVLWRHDRSKAGRKA